MDGLHTEIKQSSLFHYGIETEGSDIRAHVGPIAMRVYVYPTAEMLSWITLNRDSLAVGSATQPGVNGDITGQGPLVPLSRVGNFVRSLCFQTYPWHTFPAKDKSTPIKGAAAVAVVVECLRLGRFPLWINAQEDDRKSIQISGIDIIVFAKKKIQVKCDYLAGPREIKGCSGNLFVQTHEKNPKGLF